jgi:Rrf2 family protein
MKGLSEASILALHGLHVLVRKQAPVRLKEIQKTSGFDLRRIDSVMRKLRRAGLVRTTGRGYILARAPGEISILEVIRSIDVPRPPTAPCSGDYDACTTRASCLLAPICRDAERAFHETLSRYTLAEFEDVAVDLPNCMDPKLRTAAS